jgi:opacity protein-like surface antigen
MHKLRSLSITVLALFLIGTAAASYAAGPFLQGGFMGLNLTPASPRSGFIAHRNDTPAFAGSLGLRLSPQWRLGGELSYTARGHASGGETQSRIALVNLYYDFDVGKSRFKPFLSIGAGLASDDYYRGGIDGLGIASTSSTSGVWQAGGGLSYSVNDDVSISGGYRHLGFTSPASGNISSRDGDHEVRVGVTWKLPVKRNRGVPGQ